MTDIEHADKEWGLGRWASVDGVVTLGCLAGFLTPYDVDDFQGALERVLDANSAPVFCTLRTRKCCEVFLCAPPRRLCRHPAAPHACCAAPLSHRRHWHSKQKAELQAGPFG